MAELTDSITDILLSGSTAQKTEPTDIASAMLRAKAGRSSYGEELNRIKAQKISESTNLMKTMTFLIERQDKDRSVKRQADMDTRTARNQVAEFLHKLLSDYDLTSGVNASRRLQEVTAELERRFPSAGPIPTNADLSAAIPEIMGRSGFARKDEGVVEERKQRAKPRTIKRGDQEVEQAFNKESGQWEDISTAPRWQPPKDPAIQAKIDALVSSGTPLQVAQRIAGGQYVESRHPVTGETGRADLGASPGQAAQPTAPLPQTAPAAVSPERTIWEMSDLVSGPVPAALELGHKLPLVGGLVPGGPETQARNDVKIKSREFINTLQKSPRFAEGERETLEEELSIAPELIQRGESYRNRIIGIDDALSRRADAARKDADTGGTPEIKKQAIKDWTLIQNFRQNLGIPARARTDTEAEALVKSLGPGGQFLFREPDGTWSVHTIKSKANAR